MSHLGRDGTHIDPLSAAGALASRGWRVFACGQDKKPLSKWREAATTEIEALRRLFQGHPDAMIGVATGEASGIYVVDLDVDKATGELLGETTLREIGLARLLDSVPSVRTPSGGRHLYFRHPGPGFGNTAGKIGRGIDTRGDGGYVIGPGSQNGAGAYVAQGPLSLLPELPEELRAILEKSVQDGATSTGSYGRSAALDDLLRGVNRDHRDRAYAEAALVREVQAVMRSTPGGRNAQLNTSAFALGSLIAAGALERGRVEGFLTDAALAVGLDNKEIARTLKSGIDGGMRHPREMPERERGQRRDYRQTRNEDAGTSSNSTGDHGRRENDGTQRRSITDHLCLSAADWIARDIPSPQFVLGQWLTTTSRAMLVAPTGLGKTNVCLGMATAMAGGGDFLHWFVAAPVRVLYIDGEMSRRLMKQRVADACNRFGAVPENLFVLCRDDIPDDDEGMHALNTLKGQAFVDTVIEDLGGVDFVFFDNVQALIEGDMKDEEGWSQTLPWAKTLTKRSIGQLWVHHTGHDASKSYGTKTREWQLDTVILLEALERPDVDIAFALKFTKARERNPENRADFAPVTVTLDRNRWQVEAIDPQATGGRKRLTEEAEVLMREINNLFSMGVTAKLRPEPDMPLIDCITKVQLRDFLVRRGWLRVSDAVSGLETDVSDEVSALPQRAETIPKTEHTRLWKRLNTLKANGLIGQTQTLIWRI